MLHCYAFYISMPPPFHYDSISCCQHHHHYQSTAIATTINSPRSSPQPPLSLHRHHHHHHHYYSTVTITTITTAPLTPLDSFSFNNSCTITIYPSPHFTTTYILPSPPPQPSLEYHFFLPTLHDLHSFLPSISTPHCQFTTASLFAIYS